MSIDSRLRTNLSAKYFEEISKLLKPIYDQIEIIRISEINKLFIKKICSYLEIKTNISFSGDKTFTQDKNLRLINICKDLNCNVYVTGPSAKNYLDETLFLENKIDVSWFQYSDYIEYNQLWGKFNHNVSIVDLLFNCGKNSKNYLKYV